MFHAVSDWPVRLLERTGDQDGGKAR